MEVLKECEGETGSSTVFQRRSVYNDSFKHQACSIFRQSAMYLWNKWLGMRR